MKIMKRLIVLVCALMLVFSMAACSSNGKKKGHSFGKKMQEAGKDVKKSFKKATKKR